MNKLLYFVFALLFSTSFFAQRDGFWDKERATTKEINLSAGKRALIKTEDLPDPQKIYLLYPLRPLKGERWLFYIFSLFHILNPFQNFCSNYLIGIGDTQFSYIALQFLLFTFIHR